MKRFIFERLEDATDNQKIVKLLFTDPRGIDSSRWLSINSKDTSTGNIVDRLNEIFEEGHYIVSPNAQGSDAEYERQEWVLDTDVFKFIFYKTLRGGCCDSPSKKHIFGVEKAIAYSYKSKNNNCLLEIIRKSIGINEKSDQIRKKLGFEKGTKLNISEDLPKLANEFKFNYVVVQLDKDNKLERIGGEVDDEYDQEITFILDNDHFYKAIFMGESPEEKEERLKEKAKKQNIKDYEKRSKESIKKNNDKRKEKKEKKEIEYIPVCFDFESFFNAEGKEYAYSCSLIYDNDEKHYEFFYPNKEDIEKMDFTKRPIERMVITKVNEIYKNTGKKVRLIGYNSSRFDNFFLLASHLENDETPSLMYCNNAILSMETKAYKTFDMCRFVNCSLKTACKDFKLKNKKIDGFSHTIPQNEANNGTLNKWLLDNYSKVFEYCMMDSRCLQELYNTVKEAVLQISGNKIKIDNFLTISGAGVDYWKKTDVNKDYDNMKVIRSETIKQPRDWNIKTKCSSEGVSYLYDMVRSSLTAGRSQMFENYKKVEKPIMVIDATSLYPFAMSGEFLYPDPYSEMIYTDKYRGKDVLGFYWCNIISQPKKNIIPYRTKGEPLNWEYDKPIYNIALNTIDIECLKKHNSIVEVYNGIYWTKKTNKMFSEYIDVFKKEKMRQDELKELKSAEYNAAMRAMCKLFSNSLSGKVIERLHEDAFLLTNKGKEHLEFANKYIITESTDMANGTVLLKGTTCDYQNLLKTNSVPHYLGCFIYAHARQHMYDNIISKYAGYGMDTDSYFMEESEYLRAKKEQPKIFGSEYGNFKVENYEGAKNKKWTRNYFVCSKVYGLFSEVDSEDNKTRFKGLNNNDRIMSEADIKVFNKCTDVIERYELYEKLKPVAIIKRDPDESYINEEVYKTLCDKKALNVLSSVLYRSNLKLHVDFVIKTIKPEKDIIIE